MRKETADFYFYFCVWIFLQANGFKKKKTDFMYFLNIFLATKIDRNEGPTRPKESQLILLLLQTREISISISLQLIGQQFFCCISSA